ncbi:MAG: DUF4178 domain-containing protein [Cyclobacteriaceae bacterium]
MFDFLKKKKEEPEYDVTNLSLRDLNFGFLFDYDMKSWVVKEVYEYDWGSNNFTKEFKIDSGDQVAFLHIEDDDELVIQFTNSIKLRKIDEDVAEEIEKNEKPPKTLHHDGETYYLEGDSAGYFRDLTKKTEDWEELIAWEYYNDDEDKVLSITQWDEFNIEAGAGIVLKEFQFSNIIPGQ